MAKNKEEKTNVMRVLEQKKIAYTPHSYPHEEGMAVDGVTVAKSMGFDPPSSSRPLSRAARANSITSSTCRSRRILNLKKAAKADGEKSIEMIQPERAAAAHGATSTAAGLSRAG